MSGADFRYLGRPCAHSPLTAAAAATLFSTPAQALEVCDPVVPRGVCVYIVDEREGCPPGYIMIRRIDNPVDGSVLIVRALA